MRAQQSHAWARFQPESWKSVRVSHSLLDTAGKVTSEVITLTTTDLIEASGNQYTLSVESTVKIGEQRVNQSKQRIKRDINAKGEGFSDVVKTATIKIGDYEMPVEVFTVEYSTKKGKRISKVYVSKETMPSMSSPPKQSSPCLTMELGRLPQFVVKTRTNLISSKRFLSKIEGWPVESSAICSKFTFITLSKELNATII